MSETELKQFIDADCDTKSNDMENMSYDDILHNKYKLFDIQFNWGHNKQKNTEFNGFKYVFNRLPFMNDKQRNDNSMILNNTINDIIKNNENYFKDLDKTRYKNIGMLFDINICNSVFEYPLHLSLESVLDIHMNTRKDGDTILINGKGIKIEFVSKGTNDVKLEICYMDNKLFENETNGYIGIKINEVYIGFQKWLLSDEMTELTLDNYNKNMNDIINNDEYSKWINQALIIGLSIINKNVTDYNVLDLLPPFTGFNDLITNHYIWTNMLSSKYDIKSEHNSSVGSLCDFVINPDDLKTNNNTNSNDEMDDDDDLYIDEGFCADDFDLLYQNNTNQNNDEIRSNKRNKLNNNNDSNQDILPKAKKQRTQ